MTMTDTGSTDANGKSQGSRGKAMLLALGKGFPDQVLPQEKVAASYLQESSCDDPDTRAKLELTGLAEPVRRLTAGVVTKDTLGVGKPAPEVFRSGCSVMGLEPGEVVYVGDLYSVDVLGARAAGLAAVLLDPGTCWGARDCLTAPGVLAAVQQILNTAES